MNSELNLYPDAVLIVDDQGIIRDANQAASEITEYSKEELIGLKVEALIPEEWRDKHVMYRTEMMSRLDSRQHNRPVELSLFTKTHQETPVEISIKITCANNRTFATLAIRDISDTRKLHDVLVEKESMLEQAQAVSKAGCWKWNLLTDKLLLSNEAKRIYGFALDQEELTHARLMDRIPKQEKERVANAINESVLLETDYRVVHQIIHPGKQEPVLVEQFGELTKDRNGKVIAMLGVVKDVTEQKQTEFALSVANNVFNHSAEAMMVTDLDNRIIRVNEAFETITQFSAKEALGKTRQDLIQSDKHTREDYEQLWSVLNKTSLWKGELWDKRKDGSCFPSQHTISAVRDGQGRVIQYIDLFSDITEKKQQEESIQNLAHYDQLTGLPNRALFVDRLKQSIQRARRKNQHIGLMFIDLDRFKYVNDTLGHDAGDALLAKISMRLSETVREQDTVARLGGDEFTIILEELAIPQDGILVAEKLIQYVCKPLDIKGHEVVVGASIGISVFPDHGDDQDTLIKCADTAMYHAKESGRNRCKLYDSSLSAKASERFHLERLLRKAIEEQEFELYFQPQINITSGKVCGCETLIRWNNPEHGLIGPMEFIPLAEETGLIIPLGEWVLHQSLISANNWKSRGIEQITISVNVSSKQLSAGNFAEKVRQLVALTEFQPQRLELEITESAVMENPNQVIAELNQIRDLGVNISLDDFGTGYSSLSYLKKLPVTKVKIDRSFVRDINIDKDDEEIVKAIIAMSRTLGLKVIAEGAETKDHIDFIRRADCDDVQGYYYSRPLPEDDFIRFVTEFNKLSLSDGSLPAS